MKHFNFLIFNLNKFDKDCQAKKTLCQMLTKAGYVELQQGDEGDGEYTFTLWKEKQYDDCPPNTIIITINYDINELKRKASLSLEVKGPQDEDSLKLYIKSLYNLFEEIDEESDLSITYESCKDHEFLKNILQELLEDKGVLPL